MSAYSRPGDDARGINAHGKRDIMQRNRSRWAAALAIALAFSAPSAALASGGSGGGGGGGTATSGTATGGTATGGGGGGGGGGGTKTCSPSISLTATPSPVSGVRSITASFAAACASKTHVAISAVNAATGVVEWVAPSDSLLTSYTWSAPLFGTTYRVDALLYSSTNALLATASKSVTTLPAPADCGPFLTVGATAGTTAATFGITSSYSLVWCGGTSTVLLTATNTDTGVMEWSQYAASATDVLFATPQFGANYRIDAIAYDGATVLARASTVLTTPVAPPNCASITNENLSVGYWGVYAAVWISTTAKDCGYGRTSVHMRITNLDTGLVEYEAYGLPLNTLIDFEGPVVKYDTNYEVDVDVRGAMNELLDSTSQVMLTPPLR